MDPFLSGADGASTLITNSSVTAPLSNILVGVRIRPLDPAAHDATAFTWDSNAKTIVTVTPTSSVNSTRESARESASKPFTFDYLFSPDSATVDVFTQLCRNLVLKSLEGFHGSVLAYGQTSSGKTHTMSGCASNPGIIPLSVKEAFERASLLPERTFVFRVSYLEVYNEQIRDLLALPTLPNSIEAEIKIQSTRQGTVVSGVREVVVNSAADALALLRTGDAQRHVGSTEMNEKSSRAHTIFRMHIESQPKQTLIPDSAPSSSSDTTTRVATLSLVDLAGSECAKMTGADGDRAREAKYINQSLLTLSLIVQRLSEEASFEPVASSGSDRSSTGSSSSSSSRRRSKMTSHLPYRDSKLTRLLENSLNGTSHIAVICTISPTLRCCDESINTLKFAQRAKSIKTAAVKNEILDDKTLLKLYRAEILQLRAKLQAAEGGQWQRHDTLNSGAEHESGGNVGVGGLTGIGIGFEGEENELGEHLNLLQSPSQSFRGKSTTVEEGEQGMQDGEIGKVMHQGQEGECELDEDEEQAQTLRMIQEMEDLIMRVALKTKSRGSTPSRLSPSVSFNLSSSAELIDGEAAATAVLEERKAPAVSLNVACSSSDSDLLRSGAPTPSSVASTPPQYLPTWKDSGQSPELTLDASIDDRRCASGTDGEDWNGPGTAGSTLSAISTLSGTSMASGVSGVSGISNVSVSAQQSLASLSAQSLGATCATSASFADSGYAASQGSNLQTDNNTPLRGALTTSFLTSTPLSPNGQAVVTSANAEQSVSVRDEREKEKESGRNALRFGFVRKVGTGTNAANSATAAAAAAEDSNSGEEGPVTVDVSADTDCYASASQDASSPWTGSEERVAGIRARTNSFRDRETRDRTLSFTSNDGETRRALSSVSVILLKLKGKIKQSFGKNSPPRKSGSVLPSKVSSSGGDSAGGLDLTELLSPSQLRDSYNAEIARAEEEALRMELRLMTSDNKFLQQELAEKESLLELLTAGLREVEAQQEHWLQNNEELSLDLTEALQVIDEVSAENAALKESLRKYEERGIEPGIVERHVELFEEKINRSSGSGSLPTSPS